MTPDIELGMVHGRFQPFHTGHLQYVLHAHARCRHLVIGITNPDPTHVRHEDANPTRSRPGANPYPYWLRQRMVHDALLDERVDPGTFTILPFPIHEPDLWHHYVPPGVVHLLRVFSGWEEDKLARFEAAGYRTEVVDPGAPKRTTGTAVRRAVAEDGDWRELVPAATARALEDYLASEARR